MKILFKNKTKYTEELYLKYCYFHSETTFLKSRLYNIFIIGLILFIIVVQAQSHNYEILILLGGALTLFIMWRLFYPVYLGKRELNSETIVEEKEYVLTFYEDYFSIETDIYITKIKYKDLYRVRITDEYSYLYTQNRYAFIMDNSCFSVGTISTFKPFMHRKCKWKYKYYDKIGKEENDE